MSWLGWTGQSGCPGMGLQDNPAIARFAVPDEGGTCMSAIRNAQLADANSCFESETSAYDGGEAATDAKSLVDAIDMTATVIRKNKRM